MILITSAVCGVFLNVKSVKYTIVEGNLFCLAYKAYFGVQVGEHDKSWAPQRGLRKLSVHSGVVVQRGETKTEVWRAKNLAGRRQIAFRRNLLCQSKIGDFWKVTNAIFGSFAFD